MSAVLFTHFLIHTKFIKYHRPRQEKSYSIYTTNLVPLLSTIMRGLCLTSLTEDYGSAIDMKKMARKIEDVVNDLIHILDIF